MYNEYRYTATLQVPFSVKYIYFFGSLNRWQMCAVSWNMNMLEVGDLEQRNIFFSDGRNIDS